MLGGEPPVVGDDHALGLLATIDHVLGDAVGAAAHVVEGVVVGDARAPAVGAEDDRGGAGASSASRQTRSSGCEQRSMSASMRSRSGAVPRSTAIGCTAVMLPRSGGATTPSRPSTRRTTRSSVSDVDRLAGLDDRPPLPRAPMRRQQRRPDSDVRPADVHRRHDDASVTRRRLHHRVVDRDRAGSLVRASRASGRARPSARAIWSNPVYRSSAARIARRRQRNMPAFQATPSCSASSSRARRLRLLLETEQRIGPQAVDRRRRGQGRGSR